MYTFLNENLSENEDKRLVALFGPRCQSLASGIVQLFLADPPGCDKWRKEASGVVCFMKDSSKRSFFIQVFDIERNKLAWQQEVYRGFEYNTPCNFFHTFEAHDRPAGLNFAMDGEARNFAYVVQNKLMDHKRRREQKANRQKQDSEVPKGPTVSSIGAPKDQLSASLSMNPDKKARTAQVTRGKSKRVTKRDIGIPMHFRHVQHLGLNASGDSLQVQEGQENDPLMKKLLSTIGVSSSVLEDDRHKEQIYNFIDKHGGMDRLKEEMNQGPQSAPPPPPVAVNDRAPPLPPPPASDRAPPPTAHLACNRSLPPTPPSTPPRTPTPRRAPPPPPPGPTPTLNRGPPPPPPSVMRPPHLPPGARPPPPPPSQQHHDRMKRGAPVPPPPSGPVVGVPPPPPPPPAPPMPALPPETPAGPREGAQRATPSDAEGGRSALLRSIENFRGGLKSVKDTPPPTPEVRSTYVGHGARESQSLADMMRQAMNERILRFQDSDTDDSDDDDNDEEWDY